jgi:hypothetical protein
MVYRYIFLLLLACAALRPAAFSQAEYLAPVPDYQIHNRPDSWAIGDYLYFTLFTGHHHLSQEFQLWVSHVPSGTAQTLSFPPTHILRHIGQQDDGLYCYTESPQGFFLHLIEAGGIRSTVPVPRIRRFVLTPDWGKGICFIADHVASDLHLLLSDGTPAGTMVLATQVSPQSDFGQLGDRLFFTDRDNQLRFSEGTPGSSPSVQQLAAPASAFWRAGQVLFFQQEQQGIWCTDGTADGTYLLLPGREIASIAAGEEGAVLTMKRFGDGITETWGTDGTLANTHLLQRLSGFFSRAFALAGQLFFYGQDAASGRVNLWRSDGSPTGTSVALPLEEQYDFKGSVEITPVGDEWGLLLGDGPAEMPTAFIFDGRELLPIDYWLAPAQLSFGQPGENTFFKRYERLLDGHWYGPLMHPDFGVELWRIASDGSSSMIADIAPGLRWSDPRPLGLIQGWLYLLARRPGEDTGLYRVDLSSGSTLEQPAPPEREYRWLQSIVPYSSLIQTNARASAYTGEIMTSPSGQIYITGENTGFAGLAFPGQEAALPPAQAWRGNTQYLALLDAANGKLKWIRSLAFEDTKFNSNSPLLAPAPAGGAYVANTFLGEATFGDTSLESAQIQAYVACFDSSGQAIWHLTASLGNTGSGRIGSPVALLAGRDSSLYLACVYYFYQTSIGGVAVAGTSSPALLVARISAEGEVLDTRSFDLPNYWSHIGETVNMVQGKDGQLYLLLNQAGRYGFQTCQFKPLRVLLHAFREDLSQLQWRHELVFTDFAYATALAVAPDGDLYMAGRFRGTLEWENQTISAPCDAPTSFIASFSPEGQLRELADFAPANVLINDMQFEPSGNYLLVGTQLHEDKNRHYPGYEEHIFASGWFSVFAQRRHLCGHQLLGERHFLKPGQSDPFLRYDFPRLATLPDGGIVLQDRLRSASILDTLGFPYLRYQNPAFVLSFDLPNNILEEPIIDKTPIEDWAPVLAPNPTDGLAWILLPSADLELELSLHNMAGQPLSLSRSRWGNYQYLDLTPFPAGVYVLTMRWAGRIRAAKIVKI